MTHAAQSASGEAIEADALTTPLTKNTSPSAPGWCPSRAT